MFAIARFCLPLIDEVDNIEEPSSCPVADQGPGKCDRQMRLSCSRSADQNEVMLPGEEIACGELAGQSAPCRELTAERRGRAARIKGLASSLKPQRAG